MVTGASRGIGLAICQQLAASGWRLVLVARDETRLHSAQTLLDASVPGCVVDCRAVDLGQRAEVERLAAGLLRAGREITALVHNAGVIRMRRELTVDGVERTWATNVVAPFVLTRRLQPVLPPHPGTRVIFMSSLVQRWGRIHWQDPGLAQGYSADAAYNQSKLALRLLARAWAVRQPGWLALSMEPGMTATDFGSDYTGFRAWMRRLYRPFMATPAQAADTACWLATADAAGLVAGGHYRRRARVPMPSDGADDALAGHLFDLLDRDAR